MPGTHLLPPNLLKLFAPRPPVPYARPVGRDPDRVMRKWVHGVGSILERLKDEQVAAGIVSADEQREREREHEDMEEGEETVYTYAEETKRQMLREEKKKSKAEVFRVAKETYKPQDDPEIVGDPYKTLFISRLAKTATETDLRREFQVYGTVERVRIVRDKQGKSRGYAFIVYERERDMKAAYKESDGLQILGKRILVDVERGRTVRGWKPRRLGGGLGGRPKKVVEVIPSFGGPRGGFRGGRGGGFGDRGGRGRGGFRGGGGGGGPPFGGDRGYQDRGFRGGSFRGGRGIGYAPQGNGYGHSGGFGGGGGGGGGPHGYRSDLKRESGPGGYDDREYKRMRY